jgi:ATP-dependent DNA helicase RecG
MPIDDLPTLLRAGESEHVEFKTSLADSKRIVETVAAMATLGGGTIVVGVRDDGRVIGADLGEGALEQLSQRVLAGTDPKVFVRLRAEPVDGQPVLRIDVPPGDGPHLANGRAFTRSGPATVLMSRDEYERRLLDRSRESAGYERQVVPDVPLDALDSPSMRRFVDLAGPRGVAWEGDPASLLERLHLLREGRPTVGAVLLFGQDPQRVLPQATVRLRVARGAVEEGAVVEGGLIRQIEETVRQVQLRLRRHADRSGLVRREVDELPAVAVREVIVNAIAHRDYRSTAPTQVRLDDEKLEVWNPGHLPEPLTVAALRRAHPSVPPNPRIARALYLAGFVEEWGTGTLRVVSSMAAQRNAEPVFEASLGGISVALPLLGAEHALVTARQSAVLARLRAATVPIRGPELADALAVSARTLQNELAALESLGLVARVGRGKAVRWTTVR